ncbi:MAG: hypothetical protein RR185_06760 [Angelakisella sp.]
MGKKAAIPHIIVAVGLLLALLLTVGVMPTQADGIPLPTTPPLAEQPPSSPSEQLPVQDSPSQTQRAPQTVVAEPEPTGAIAMAAKEDSPGAVPLDTATVLLLGAAIWYFVVLVGITGGRRGRGSTAQPHRR